MQFTPVLLSVNALVDHLDAPLSVSERGYSPSIEAFAIHSPSVRSGMKRQILEKPGEGLIHGYSTSRGGPKILPVISCLSFPTSLDLQPACVPVSRFLVKCFKVPWSQNITDKSRAPCDLHTRYRSLPPLPTSARGVPSACLRKPQQIRH